MLHSIQPSFSKLTVELQPPAAILTLSNRPLNVIDIPMMSELAAAFASVESRKDVSILVITGDGDNFSAGVDIKAHTPEQVGEMLAKFHAVVRALVRSRLVSIAAVRGNCLGGGSEVAMMCDLVYCTEESQWGFPEIQLACFPPVAAVALADLVGKKRATEMILTGHVISGDEAFHIGLVTDAVPEPELNDTVRHAAERLASLSPAALAVTKRALNEADFDLRLARAEQMYMDELMKTDDAREGIRAWIEKREPRWSGR